MFLNFPEDSMLSLNEKYFYTLLNKYNKVMLTHRQEELAVSIKHREEYFILRPHKFKE